MTAPAHELPLASLAATQGGVVTTAQLRHGLAHDRAALRRAVRSGAWFAVQRGAYAPGPPPADPVARHVLACAARLLLSPQDLVVSHRSAALMDGVRMLDRWDGAPELTLVRPPGTPPRHVRGVLAAGVPADQRETRGGLARTTRPRTVADLARTLPRPAAVVVADAALRDGVDRLDVLAVLATCRRWPGVQDAVDALVFADRRAESALESLARVWFSEAGLPAPALQIRLCTAADGAFVARADFFWPQHRTVCEVDGRVKYEQPDGTTPERSALWHEKRREDALRDLGLEVVRGYWSDGRDGGLGLVDRVRRAFARAALRRDEPAYGVLRGP